MLGISWKSGLEAFSQLLQIGSCFLLAEHTDLDATMENWNNPTCLLHPFVLLFIQYSWSVYFVRTPMLGAGGDIKRYSAFQIG